MTVKEQIAKEMRDRLFDLQMAALLGGWPVGYQPGEGFPGTLTADKIKPPRCDKIISLDIEWEVLAPIAPNGTSPMNEKGPASRHRRNFINCAFPALAEILKLRLRSVTHCAGAGWGRG